MLLSSFLELRKIARQEKTKSSNRYVQVGCALSNGVSSYNTYVKEESRNTTLHAEMRALGECAKKGIPTEGCTLYVTLSPCVHCAKIIITHGISEVYYDEIDKLEPHGITLLEEAGVKTVLTDV
jgi:deoxycytidylate deaminase